MSGTEELIIEKIKQLQFHFISRSLPRTIIIAPDTYTYNSESKTFYDISCYDSEA